MPSYLCRSLAKLSSIHIILSVMHTIKIHNSSLSSQIRHIIPTYGSIDSAPVVQSEREFLHVFNSLPVQ